MGAKRTWRRKHIFFYFACGLTLVTVGSACLFHAATDPFSKSDVDEFAPATVESFSQDTPGMMPVSTTMEKSVAEYLKDAYLALIAGDYTIAHKIIEKASNATSASAYPETIYLSALLYSDSENPDADMVKAYEAFQRIETEYPEFNRGAEIRILSDLLFRVQSTEIENDSLQKEIDQLKKNLSAEKNSVQRLKSLLKKMKEIDLDLIPKE
jgi:hypothetical protein